MKRNPDLKGKNPGNPFYRRYTIIGIYPWENYIYFSIKDSGKIKLLGVIIQA
jgi:hypothetical protein